MNNFLVVTIIFNLCFSIIICSQTIEKKSSDNKNKIIIPEKVTSVDGMFLYSKFCMSCHQADGSGVPNMYPPLQKSDWIIGDKNRFIKTVLKGLSGEIKVNDEFFNQTMPKADYLNDLQLAHILTFIMQKFNNLPDSIQPNEINIFRNLNP
jgi:mono/diheme cytochrome c family protein